MPFSGTVHYITAHVHQYLDTITLIDPASGEILNSIRLEHDARGWPRGFPAYSDAIGIRLVRGARYVVKMSFSNPREVPVDSFARVSLYAHRDDDR
jgi:hypothetical protein